MEYMDFDNIKLGSWAIEPNLFLYIVENLQPGYKILELGSGSGTVFLSENYNVTSIEHNADFVGLSKKSAYIHAPIIDDWYDVEKLKDLPEYDLLLIDGPSSREGDRIWLIQHLDLFNIKDQIIIIDDVNRQGEFDLMVALGAILNRPFMIHKGEDKDFGVLR